jgi:hypothetical protein
MASQLKRKKSDAADEKSANATPKTPKPTSSSQIAAASPSAARNADVSTSASALAPTSILPLIPKRRGRPVKNGLATLAPGTATPAPGTIPATATASAQITPVSISKQSIQMANAVPPSPISSQVGRPSSQVQVTPTLTPTRVTAPVTGFTTLAENTTKGEFRSPSATEWSRAAQGTVEDTKGAAQSPAKRARLDGDQESEQAATQLNAVSPAANRQVPVALETDVNLATAAWTNYQMANNGQAAAPDSTKAEDFISAQAVQQRAFMEAGSAKMKAAEERYRQAMELGARMASLEKQLQMQSQQQIQSQKVNQAQLVGLQQHQSRVQAALGGTTTPRSNAIQQQIGGTTSLTSEDTTLVAQNLPLQAAGISVEDRTKLHFDHAAQKRGESMRLSTEWLSGRLNSPAGTGQSGSAMGFVGRLVDGNISTNGTWGIMNGSTPYNPLQNSPPSSSSAQAHPKALPTTLPSQSRISSHSPMPSHSPIQSNSFNPNKNINLNYFSPSINSLASLKHRSPSHPTSPHFSPQIPSSPTPYLSSPTPTPTSNAPNPRKWVTTQHLPSTPLHPPSFTQTAAVRLFNPLLSHLASPGLYHPNTTSSSSESPASDDGGSGNTPRLYNTSEVPSNGNINNSNDGGNTESGALPSSSNLNPFSPIPIAQSNEQAQHMRNMFTPQQIQQLQQQMEFLRSNTQSTVTGPSTAVSASNPFLLASLNTSSSTSSSSSLLPDINPPHPPSNSLCLWPLGQTQNHDQNQTHARNQNQSTPENSKPSIARELITEQINALQSSAPLSHAAEVYLAQLKVVQQVQKRLEGAWARGARRADENGSGMGLDGVREGGDESSRQSITAAPGKALSGGRVLALDKLKVVQTPRYTHPNNNRHRQPSSSADSQTRQRAMGENGERGLCHFCTPGMEFDFGIAEYAPKENNNGLDTGSIDSVNIWAQPGEKVCKGCATHPTGLSHGPLNPQTQNQRPGSREKTLSQIDNQDISAYMPNQQCRCCAWRILDVGKAQICRDCKEVKMGIVRHGRHLEFEAIDGGLGMNRGREGRCMVCVYRAEYRCKGCELRVCEGCRGALIWMCEFIFFFCLLLLFYG